MLKLDHVVFPIRDAARSLAFYRDVLGLPLAEAHTDDDWGGRPWLMMIFALPGGGEIVLVELKDAPAPDYQDLPADVRHYAMSVASHAEVDAWRARLKAAGVDYWEEAHGERRSVYFPDPDGVILEVTAPASAPAQRTSEDALRTVERWVAARA